jgi:hypothetical protein
MRKKKKKLRERKIDTSNRKKEKIWKEKMNRKKEK